MRSELFRIFLVLATLLLIAGCGQENEDIVQPTSLPSKTLQVQWQRRSTPAPATVGTMASSPAGVLYALTEATVERSTDNGDTWATVSHMSDARCIAAGPGDVLLLGSVNAGVLISRDGGSSWIKTGLTNASVYRVVIAANGTQYATASTGTWAAGANNLWVSLDGGSGWNPIALASPFTIVGPGTILMATVQGIIESNDNGKTWTKVSSLAGVWRLTSAMDGTVYATQNSAQGIYRSDDRARTWTRIYGSSASDLSVDDHGNVLAQLGNGCIRTTDRGVTWETVPGYDPSMHVVGPDGGRSAFATTPAGLWRTTSGVEPWTCVRKGGITSRITCLVFDWTTGDMLAGTASSGLFISSDKGAFWRWTGGPIGQLSIVAANVTKSGAILVAAFKDYDNLPAKLFRSTDRGQSWAMVSASTWIARGIMDDGHGAVLMAGADGAYCSHDDGVTWAKSSLSEQGVQDFATNSSGTLFAATAKDYSAGQIARSTDRGSQWSIVFTADVPINALVCTPRGSIVATSSYASFRSTDNGSTWGRFPITPNAAWRFLSVNSLGYLLASAHIGGALASVDDGVTWQDVSGGVSRDLGPVVCFDSEDYAYCTAGPLIYRSATPAVAAQGGF